MKTKTIPFDLELAKKIQEGEIQGKIMYNDSEVEILGFDMYVAGDAYLCAKTKGNSGEYRTRLFDKQGKDAEDKYGALYNLYLEVPDDEPQYKPYDRVLVNVAGFWRAAHFSHIDSNEEGKMFAVTTSGDYYELEDNKIVPYEGNEHLVGTKNKPKED